MWTDPDSSSPKWAPCSLKPGQCRIAEEPHNTPGGVENNSTDSQTLPEKSHKPGDGSTKTPNVLLLWLWGLGWQMRDEGHRAEQRGGPSAPQHMQCHLAALSVSITQHPLFPSLSSQCIPSEAASSAKRAIFFFGWAKTQHPARWNLAAVCLLVLTELEALPLLSGDVVALLPGSLMLSVCSRNRFTNTKDNKFKYNPNSNLAEYFKVWKPLAIFWAILSQVIIKHALPDATRKQNKLIQTSGR